ncbi:hypothetical protein CCACVL1_29368 [Corchorus capsularis]|uniref:Uncharacterized protein n=1 Tax=Corchorus capsularis TaxID=210143 RepID=A0A1R3G1W6_COCAP|nr:hypothetical protein CCACVL1_29368 [Corchorus capsularis]
MDFHLSHLPHSSHVLGNLSSESGSAGFLY